MIVFASEDVGNADPQALQVAVAAARAVEFVGLPEARINLAQARRLPGPGAQVERQLRRHRQALRGRPRARQPATAASRSATPATPGAAKLGHGTGYKYPHDYPGGRGRAAVPARRAGRHRLLRPGDAESDGLEDARAER